MFRICFKRQKRKYYCLCHVRFGTSGKQFLKNSIEKEELKKKPTTNCYSFDFEKKK